MFYIEWHVHFIGLFSKTQGQWFLKKSAQNSAVERLLFLAGWFHIVKVNHIMSILINVSELLAYLLERTNLVAVSFSKPFWFDRWRCWCHSRVGHFTNILREPYTERFKLDKCVSSNNSHLLFIILDNKKLYCKVHIFI